MASSSSAVAAMDFSDLVQSAEQLTSDCDLNVVSCSSVPHLSSSTSSAGADLPRVQRNLSQLVDAGHQLMAKTARDVGGQEVKAAILLGSKGVDLPAIQQQLLSITRSEEAFWGLPNFVGPSACLLYTLYTSRSQTKPRLILIV
jgi:hypothetical protein